MDIKKHFDTIIQLIKNKLPNRKQADIDADTIGMDEDDNEPGNVKLSDGAQDKTLGINKKVVNMAILGIVITFVIAFLYASNDKNEKNQAKDVQIEHPADINGKRDEGNTDYKTVQAQLMQQANQNKKGQNGVNRNPDTPPNVQQSYNQQPVPAIRSTVPQNQYSSPYMLPSALAHIDAAARANNPASASGQQAGNVQSNNEDKIIERFKSAISFALGEASMVDSENAAGSVATADGIQNAAYEYYGPSNTVLQAGSIIPAILHTGINTDHDGQVIAVIQSDVYDTATGSNLLIPMGSKMIGAYSSGGTDTDRVAVNFSQIVFPNGASYAVGPSMIAVDEQGYTGIRGHVNRHMDAAVGRTLLNGIMSAGFTALSTIRANRANIDTSGLQQLLQANSSVTPTITVQPGYQFNIFIKQPISFSY